MLVRQERGEAEGAPPQLCLMGHAAMATPVVVLWRSGLSVDRGQQQEELLYCQGYAGSQSNVARPGLGHISDHLGSSHAPAIPALPTECYNQDRGHDTGPPRGPCLPLPGSAGNQRLPATTLQGGTEPAAHQCLLSAGRWQEALLLWRRGQRSCERTPQHSPHRKPESGEQTMPMDRVL